MSRMSIFHSLPPFTGGSAMAACLALMVCGAQSGPSDEALRTRAARIHRQSIVVDTHSDTTSRILDEGFDMGARASDGHMDIPRMREGGMDAEFFAIYVAASYAKNGGAARRALDMIDGVYDQASRHPDALEMAYSVADIRRIARKGKIAALMGIEGGHAIEDSLRALRVFYRLGVRYMTLTHTNSNHWADSSGDEPRHNGLTDFGRDVVREMNRLGMMVDISHVSDKTFFDVLSVTQAPVIASHSSARALANHPRNMTDDMLKALSKNGGVVMVNFYPGFIDQAVIDAQKAREAALKPELDELARRYSDNAEQLRAERQKLLQARPLPHATLARLVDHIDHIVKVAGIDHVGLGSDFDGIQSTPDGLEDVSKLPQLSYELLRRGYGELEIKKILGENFLRVFRRVEAVSQPR